MTHNGITHIEKSWFQDLGGLKQLDLSQNAISEIHHDDLENLHSLEFIGLSGNQLISTDYHIFDSFRSAVEEIHLSHNRLSLLHDNLFREMWSLKVLTLKFQIYSMPSVYQSLTKLLR